MSKLVFNGNESPTLGLEVELGIVDTDAFELSSSIEQLLAALSDEESGRYKPELMQSCIEVNTEVCRDINDVERDLRAKLRKVQDAADARGLALWWGGTHPFSMWQDQRVTPTERYQDLVDLLQETARRLITFGLHVHVGVDSGDKAVMICDRILEHLPIMLALSASSPFWEGRNSGLQSHRSITMEGLPTAGLPRLMRNWSEYVWLVNHMVRTGFINTIREIWWDVRPHHNFGTVELRVCDMPGNLDDVLAIASLIQCLVEDLSNEIDEGAYQHTCHPMMVRQNKWRAVRFGNQASLVDSFNYEVKPVSQIADELVDRLMPMAQELNCTDQLKHVRSIASGPSWATQQLNILEESADPSEIVRRLSQASRIGD